MKEILRLPLNIRFVIILFDSDNRVRGHFGISGKYRGSAHKDCNTRVKLNLKIHIVVPNLKNYDVHLMQELGKFDCEINVIPNRFRKL